MVIFLLIIFQILPLALVLKVKNNYYIQISIDIFYLKKNT
jgi:hypothetical protein